MNHLLPGRLNFISLQTSLDRAIPFYAPWEIVYFLTVVLPFFPIFYIRDRRYYLRIIQYFNSTLVVCYVFFLSLPVKIERVTPQGDDFFSWGVRLNHILDNPINCFPSFHVTIAFSIAFMIQKISRSLGMLFHFLAFLISLSVLFTKAHFVYDVIGGFTLAVIGYFIFLKGFRFRGKRKRANDNAWWQFIILFMTLLSFIYGLYYFELVKL